MEGHGTSLVTVLNVIWGRRSVELVIALQVINYIVCVYIYIYRVSHGL
jgi:hypothetical protein